MNELRNFLNSITPSEQRQFAQQCGSSIGYFRKAICKQQALNPMLCVQIEQLSNGKVSRKMLRPDDWDKIWPELRLTKI